jgi:hypothetical protein
MDSAELERLARLALRELGGGDLPVTVHPRGPDQWRIEVGGKDPVTMTVRAGSGTTPQYVREQIFRQFAGR